MVTWRGRSSDGLSVMPPLHHASGGTWSSRPAAAPTAVRPVASSLGGRRTPSGDRPHDEGQRRETHTSQAPPQRRLAGVGPRVDGRAERLDVAVASGRSRSRPWGRGGPGMVGSIVMLSAS